MGLVKKEKIFPPHIIVRDEKKKDRVVSRFHDEKGAEEFIENYDSPESLFCEFT